jgi:hypothetical protein
VVRATGGGRRSGTAIAIAVPWELARALFFRPFFFAQKERAENSWQKGMLALV